jgi:allophanate hydrolase
MPVSQYGSFVAMIPHPLGIGQIETRDGELIQGFLCEPTGLEGARDISEFGGWRRFMASLASPPSTTALR